MSMTETELRRKIIKIAWHYGALVHHCVRSDRCIGSGFPDLVIAGPRGVIFAELKSDSGETDAEQDKWAWTLTRCSIYSRQLDIKHVYYLWCPQHLWSGEIDGVIKQVI